jgi:hypothetical protein
MFFMRANFFMGYCRRAMEAPLRHFLRKQDDNMIAETISA